MAASPMLLLNLKAALLALDDHHTGMHTTRPFPETYARDEQIMDNARALLAAVGVE